MVVEGRGTVQEGGSRQERKSEQEKGVPGGAIESIGGGGRVVGLVVGSITTLAPQCIVPIPTPLPTDIQPSSSTPHTMPSTPQGSTVPTPTSIRMPRLCQMIHRP